MITCKDCEESMNHCMVCGDRVCNKHGRKNLLDLTVCIGQHNSKERYSLVSSDAITFVHKCRASGFDPYALVDNAIDDIDDQQEMFW